MKDVLLVLLAIVAGVLGALRFRDGQRVSLNSADKKAEADRQKSIAEATAEHAEVGDGIEHEKNRLVNLGGDDLAAEFDSALQAVREHEPGANGRDG